MRNAHDRFGVIATSAMNEKVAARLPKPELGEKGLPAQPSECGHRAFHAFGGHITQGHGTCFQVAVAPSIRGGQAC